MSSCPMVYDYCSVKSLHTEEVAHREQEITHNLNLQLQSGQFSTFFLLGLNLLCLLLVMFTKNYSSWVLICVSQLFSLISGVWEGSLIPKLT